ILCGSGDTIAKARRVRKLLGGAMRQAGVIAAAALVALEEMRGRLGDDHRNAKAFAEGLARIPGIRIDAHRVVTNIVSFEVDADFTDADRKSTRLNSSHGSISYAVFCLKKKNN